MAFEAEPQIELPALEPLRLGLITPVQSIPRPRPITVNSRKVYQANADSVRRFSMAKRAPSWDEATSVTALEAVIDLVLRTDLSRATAMAYRSAMLWKLAEDQDQSQTARTAYAVLEQWRPGASPREDGAPRRPKGIPETDFHTLHGELGDMATTSVWAQRAQHWIVATLAVGARPVEWLDARWEDETRQALLLNTAKGKLAEPAFLAGRAAAAEDTAAEDNAAEDDAGEGDASGSDVIRVVGNIRRVPVNRAYDRMTIDAHMANLSGFLQERGARTEAECFEAFHRFRENVRIVIRRACVFLWKDEKVYGLTSMRQQFQANQRALHKGDLGAVRDLMGHTTDISGSHYGRASQAHSIFKEKAAAQRGFGHEAGREQQAANEQAPGAAPNV